MKYFVKYTVKTQEKTVKSGIADFNVDSVKTVGELKIIIKDWLGLPSSFTAGTETFKMKDKEIPDNETLPIKSFALSYELIGNVPTTLKNKSESDYNAKLVSNKKGLKQINKNG